jgi:hypothetical protein
MSVCNSYIISEGGFITDINEFAKICVHIPLLFLKRGNKNEQLSAFSSTSQVTKYYWSDMF